MALAGGGTDIENLKNYSWTKGTIYSKYANEEIDIFVGPKGYTDGYSIFKEWKDIDCEIMIEYDYEDNPYNETSCINCSGVEGSATAVILALLSSIF